MTLHPSVTHRPGSRQDPDNGDRPVETSRLQTWLGEEVMLQNIQEKTKVECREGEGGQAAREKTQIHRIPQHMGGSFAHPTTWQAQRKGYCTRKPISQTQGYSEHTASDLQLIWV